MPFLVMVFEVSHLSPCLGMVLSSLDTCAVVMLPFGTSAYGTEKMENNVTPRSPGLDQQLIELTESSSV